MNAAEANFDGLVGPTHNYAGLGPGNLASQGNRGRASNPRMAALEGLQKMRTLRELGVPQAVLPPHERPRLALLRRLGFGGTDAAVLSAAASEAPGLLAAAWSSSAMWTANAATVCPSADARDGRVHFTPANLVSALHRSIEPAGTAAVLRSVFPDAARFAHHDPLPAADALRDEGAANHTRLAAEVGGPGVQLFVYGDGGDGAAGSVRFRPRQTRAACEAVARLHGVSPARAVFARQSPAAIDAGVFHNDVICVGHRDLLLYHEAAFDDEAGTLDRLRRAAEGCERPVALRLARVSAGELPLDEAVRTYLFNSQLVDSPSRGLTLVAPEECRDSDAACGVVRRLLDEGWLDAVQWVTVRQSMANGGGPACLRLRVVLTEAERAAVAPGVWLDESLEKRLARWVAKHYRDHLEPADLADPRLIGEVHAALDELTAILGLGPIYEFQGGRAPGVAATA